MQSLKQNTFFGKITLLNIYWSEKGCKIRTEGLQALGPESDRAYMHLPGQGWILAHSNSTIQNSQKYLQCVESFTFLYNNV